MDALLARSILTDEARHFLGLPMQNDISLQAAESSAKRRLAKISEQNLNLSVQSRFGKRRKIVPASTLKAFHPSDLFLHDVCSSISACCGIVVSPETLYRQRTAYYQHDRFGQQQFRANAFRFSNYASDIQDIKLGLFGSLACLSCWRSAYNISEYQMRSSMAKVKAGQVTVISEHMYRRDSPKRMAASAFLSNFIDELGETMPDNGDIHLPQATKQQVYHLFAHHCHKYSEPVCTYEYFRLLWVNDFPHVKTPKSKRFAKCCECAEFLMRLEKATIQSEKIDIREAFNNHMEQARKERLDYHARRLRSKTNPEEVLCVIIDGMDQSKTDLPHWKRDTKRTEKMQKCKTHVMGAIAHGHGSFVSICPPWISDNANLTTEFLRQILLCIASKDDYVLPPKLSLQLDSASVNKNKAFLTFLQLLVERGAFTEIQVNFLLVGHTHEDIDQMFSCFSRGLRQNDAFTFGEMMVVFKNSYSPTPHLIDMSDVPDWARFCAGWKPANGELCGMSSERVFMIKPFARNVFPSNHIYDLCRSMDVPQDDVNLLYGKVQLTTKLLSTDESFCLVRQKNFGCFNSSLFPADMFFATRRSWPSAEFRETLVLLQDDWYDKQNLEWTEWLHKLDASMDGYCARCSELSDLKLKYTRRQKDKFSLSSAEMKIKDSHFRAAQQALTRHLHESAPELHGRDHHWSAFLSLLGDRYLPAHPNRIPPPPILPHVVPVESGRVGRRSYLNNDALGLAVGDLLIVHCPDVVFALCKLLSVDADKMLVHWWGNASSRNPIPALSSNLKPLMLLNGGGPYTEQLDADTSVIAYGFKLTQAGKLPSRTLRLISNDVAVNWTLPQRPI